MEEVEANLMEGGIGWLAQTILENLLNGDLEAWILKLGLADDTERLRSEIERVEMVVAAVKGRAIRNKPLARSLARLRELLYDADDAIDELDYYRLLQQVQGATWNESADGHGAEATEQVERPRGNTDIPSSSGGKKRSKAWGHFDIIEEKNGKPVKASCIHCHKVVQCGSDKGTSVLHNHLNSGSCKKKRGASDQPPNPSSIADDTANGTPAEIGDSGIRKRMRMHGESTHDSATNAHSWNKTEFSDRLQQIIRQLQDSRGAVSEVLRLHGSDSVASSNHWRSTNSDVCPRTSSLNQRKMYGKDVEKNAIVKIITDDNYDGITVLPIVGIGGVGKTALAQLVYDDPIVRNQFERVWVWVSNNFDEVRLTREILDFVSQEGHEGSPHRRYRHEGISSFSKLQEILKRNMEFQSNRFLLILDDVWDNMDDYQWNRLLAPLKLSHAKGNAILVTTRKLSVAQRIGTVKPIELGDLANEDFWLLFKACAFGHENYEGHASLSTIGRQIAEKLKGNPLAAETAGALLRENLTIDHWSNILKNEDWKSLQLSIGIMPALKLSYDQHPYHLQQCFLYCSIFPNDYEFLGEELVRIWISQGFVKCSQSNKRLEEIGRGYLSDLVNSGFFQQVEKKEWKELFFSRESEEFFLGDQTCYVMCGLLHDFARMISRTECATVDGLECNEIMSTIHHLSILTVSSFCKDLDEKIIRRKRFEEKMQSLATSAKQLRTLVLIGPYDNSFSQSFINVFQKAQNLRVLHISANYADFSSFMCKVVNHTHLRYMKLRAGEQERALPQVLSKFFHLQVLDIGPYTNPAIFNGITNLVSLRHLVADKGVCSSIASIGKMTSLRELHNFSVQNLSGFEVTQIKSLNKLTQLGVSRLENVRTQEEAYGASLRDKQHLEKLHLSWKDTVDEYDSDMNYESETSSEYSTDIETELLEGLPASETNGAPSSEQFSDIASEVLDGLEPHHSLKHLQISGYNGATSPTWLGTSLTCLQTLHLEDCGKWQIVSLERLLLLRKLVLIKMRNAVQVSIPALEELIITGMRKLHRCSCTSTRDLNSSLRVLKINWCPVLKVFPLFESCQEFTTERTPWLSRLTELTIDYCPELLVPHPLPPSTTVAKLSIARVSTLPTMEGSCSGELTIGLNFEESNDLIDESSDDLWTLDDKILSFHNLRFLTRLIIAGCQNLTSISLECFRQLICLKNLEIYYCQELFCSHAPPELTPEETAPANCCTLPSLESLYIVSCGIMGGWLSLMLRHVQALQQLSLRNCPQITGLSIGEDSQPNLMSDPEDSSSGYSDDAPTSSARDGLLRIPLNLISSLKKISIEDCPGLTFHGSKEGFCGFTSLEELRIFECPKLLSSLVPYDGNNEQGNGRWLLPQSLVELEIGNFFEEKLQPCFPENLTNLKKLKVRNYPSLKSLQLESCTALEELTIAYCGLLVALEGLQYLCGLRHFKLCRCSPSLPLCLESLSGQVLELFPPLERLEIDDPSVLTTSFCKHLTSLPLLQLDDSYFGRHVTRLTDEQDSAIQLLRSLQELRFLGLTDLKDLPAGLHNLPSLKKLKIWDCPGISRLPEKGLPPSLEELDISSCSKELTDQCRLLASKLKVKIDLEYVN